MIHKKKKQKIRYLYQANEISIKYNVKSPGVIFLIVTERIILFKKVSLSPHTHIHTHTYRYIHIHVCVSPFTFSIPVK